MQLNLDRMLANVRDGQWSVDDFDWSTPLEGAEALTARERREAGWALLFTAGLERQAARIFDLCADYADDERAAEIYRLFAEDERRHAEAEVRLAARYGVGPDELPRPMKWTLASLVKNWDHPERGLHELTSATILLFELALDTLLIPVLKERVADPLQAQVFRKIDLDESRHLAMDYWLLDKKGAEQAGMSFAAVVAPDGPRPLPQRLVGRYRMARTLVAMLVGFGSSFVLMPSMRPANSPERMEKYLARVAAIPDKAPRALDVPAFRSGLTGQKTVVRFLWRLSRGAFSLESAAA